MTPGHRDLRSASRNMSGCFRKPSANETCTVQRPLHCYVRGHFQDRCYCVDADGLPLTTDQRGEPRPVAIRGPEPKCDVGAFEVQP